MRAILKKIKTLSALDPSEFAALVAYIEHLGQTSLASYSLFYSEYSSKLIKQYNLRIPKYYFGADEIVNYCVQNIANLTAAKNMALHSFPFPHSYSSFIEQICSQEQNDFVVADLLNMFAIDPEENNIYPSPRQTDIVKIFEDGNAKKETGLDFHFKRLQNYSFISRIQTIKYLQKHKATKDCFKTNAPDKIRGIYTNNQKSVYYLVYLTEADPKKAANACRLLNRMFYNTY